MSLDYQRYYEDGWKNKPDRSTPVVAEALNNIDEAIIEIEEVLNHGVSEDATIVLTGTEFEPFFANKGNILIHEMLGKTVQDGTPSPTSPVDLKSVKVDLTTRTKNIIPFPYYHENGLVLNGITWTYDKRGIITANGTASSNSAFLIADDSQRVVIPKGSYKMTGCPSGGSSSTYRMRLYVAEATSQYSVGQTFTDSGNGVDFEFTEDTICRIYPQVMSGYNVQNLVFKPMLVEANSYIENEYIPPKMSVADTSIVLRSFGEYTDKLFFENGKYYVERNLAQFHVDENTNLYLQSVNDYGIANLRVIIPDVVKKYPNPIGNGDTMAVCDRFVRQKTAIASEKTVGFTVIYNPNPGGNYLYFRCDSSIAQTVNEFKAWLETNPVEVLYVLDTPIIEEVSIDDAIKLLSLMAFDGETHIIQDSVTKGETVLEYPNNRVGGLALTGFCKSTKNEIKIDAIDSLMTTMMLEEDV